MTVDYEPAPKPAPLWLLPLTIALLALALLWAVSQFTDRDVGGFGGSAQPATPAPVALVDGSPLPEVPESLSRRLGEDVVLAERLDEVPDDIEESCRGAFGDAEDPGRRRLGNFIESSDIRAAHVGPDALTYLSVAVSDAPPGYPREVEIACAARPVSDGWQTTPPYIDFALDGRPGATLPSITEEVAADGAPAAADASEATDDATDPAPPRTAASTPSSAGSATADPAAQTIERPRVRTRLVQVPLGTQWAVVPRGGWWLAYDVAETSWALLPLSDAIGNDDPLRVVFIDATGDVVAERAAGPTRPASQADHATDFELVAGAVPEVLDKLRKRPVRVCEPGNRTLCVWLSLNELDEVLAHAAFGPHPLDTPPMGYVGYCPKANQFQGSVSSARYHTDGSWAGGPSNRGLDRYTVRFEANMVVVDLSEHVIGEPASGDPEATKAECAFTGTKARGKAK